MRILLDTNVLIWAILDPARLPERISEAIASSDHEILFSAVSIWEIAIKASLGRVEFLHDPGSALAIARDTGFLEVPIRSETTIAAANLPRIHGDPFDRLLIAQAAALPARLYTADRLLARYSELVSPFNPKQPQDSGR